MSAIAGRDRFAGAPEGSPTLRVCALYPDLMNIYADRGNLLMLRRRCEWRGIGFSLAESGIGEPLQPHAHDLIYLGGGQDRDQRLCAEDLVGAKGEAIGSGRKRRRADPRRLRRLSIAGPLLRLGPRGDPGLGLLDVLTVREDRTEADRQRRR